MKEVLLHSNVGMGAAVRVEHKALALHLNLKQLMKNRIRHRGKKIKSCSSMAKLVCHYNIKLYAGTQLGKMYHKNA